MKKQQKNTTKKTLQKSIPSSKHLSPAKYKFCTILVFLAFVSCGVFIGAGFQTNNHHMQKTEKSIPVQLSAKKCDKIIDDMVNIIKTNPEHSESVELKKLDSAYRKGCFGRLVIIDEALPVIKTDKKSEPEMLSTCAQIEKLLEQRLVPENVDEYEYYIQNADIYSTLAVRGCKENSQKYKALALRSLDIANALGDDAVFQEGWEAVSVIDTYKKLEMQQQAQEFLDKMQKITSPAIDFIFQMEKIINE